MDIKLAIRRMVSRLQQDIQIANATIKDKGTNRFGRTFLAGGAFILAAYILAYAPANRKMETVGVKISRAKAESEAGDSYKSLNESLSQLYPRFPDNQQPGDWLNQSVLSCLKQVGVTATSIVPQESPLNGDFLNVESLHVTASMSYIQLLGVLRRLERLKPRVRVSTIHLTKAGGPPIGSNTIDMNVETLAPQPGFVQ